MNKGSTRFNQPTIQEPVPLDEAEIAARIENGSLTANDLGRTTHDGGFIVPLTSEDLTRAASEARQREIEQENTSWRLK